MSLLILDSSHETVLLAQKIFDMQFEQDAKIRREYDEYRKRIMLRDILYNLACLNVAIDFDSPEIFNDYALWIYKLLDARMPDLQKNRAKEHMVDHYKYISKALKETTDEADSAIAERFLREAIELTEGEFAKPS